jgi:hypothetical protein
MTTAIPRRKPWLHPPVTRQGCPPALNPADRDIMSAHSFQADSARDTPLTTPRVVTWLADALRERQRYVALTGAGAGGLGVATIVRALSVELGPDTRFVRVANPLASPLTLSRILLQIGGDPSNSVEEDVVEAVRLLAAQTGRERQVVLVVEHADTLQRNALLFLQELPNLAPVGAPILQVLFIAGPRFAALLEQGGFLWLSTRLVHLELSGTAPESKIVGPPSSRRKRRAWQAIAGLVLLAGIVAAGFFAQGWNPGPSALDDPAPAVAMAPAGDNQATTPGPDSLPGETSGNPPTADLGNSAETPSSDTPAALGAAGAAEPHGQLRQEFDAFLTASGPKYARLTEAQRELLFQQYLARSHRTRSSE